MEQRLGGLKEELLELRRKLATKVPSTTTLCMDNITSVFNLFSLGLVQNAEVGGAAEDLMLMTRENQAVTAELASMMSERDRTRQRVQARASCPLPHIC